MKKRFLAVLLFLIPALTLFAQEPGADANTGLRADGKIWVVMAVCVTILVGLLFYIWRVDRKVSALEK